MSTPGDITAPTGDVTITRAPLAGNTTFSRSDFRVIADALTKTSYIGEVSLRGFKVPRYIELEINNLFDALVELYSFHFQARWDDMHPIISHLTMPQGITEDIYMAQIYISHWFISLYSLNRDASTRHDAARYSDHYNQELPEHSKVFDCYLVYLLNTIKPTHIFGLQEDTLYIPIIAKRPNWNNVHGNYFGITNFRYNVMTFRQIIKLMTDPNSGWQTATVSNDPSGRPTWLFDWHAQKAYAWFPEEGNYNNDDVNVAFILGVACTPLLASRDDDIPQQYPDNLISYDFETERKKGKAFHSMIDVTVVSDTDYLHTEYINTEVETEVPIEEVEREAPTPTRRTAPLAIEASQAQQAASAHTETQLAAQATRESGSSSARSTRTITETVTSTKTTQYNLYKITDYKYYARVIRSVSVHVRTAAHKIFIFRE